MQLLVIGCGRLLAVSRPAARGGHQEAFTITISIIIIIIVIIAITIIMDIVMIITITVIISIATTTTTTTTTTTLLLLLLIITMVFFIIIIITTIIIGPAGALSAAAKRKRPGCACRKQVSDRYEGRGVRQHMSSRMKQAWNAYTRCVLFRTSLISRQAIASVLTRHPPPGLPAAQPRPPPKRRARAYSCLGFPCVSVPVHADAAGRGTAAVTDGWREANARLASHLADFQESRALAESKHAQEATQLAFTPQ